MTDKSLRLYAYYYSFDSTGDPAVDLILSAVACAGKAYHHTSGWTDETPLWDDRFRGATPVDWIQNAANDAVNRRAVSPAVLALVEACKRAVESCDCVRCLQLGNALAAVEKEIQ